MKDLQNKEHYCYKIHISSKKSRPYLRFCKQVPYMDYYPPPPTPQLPLHDQESKTN